METLYKIEIINMPWRMVETLCGMERALAWIKAYDHNAGDQRLGNYRLTEEHDGELCGREYECSYPHEEARLVYTPPALREDKEMEAA